MNDVTNNTKKFEGGFLVWRKVGNNLKKPGKKAVGNPRFRHPTFDAAEKEANRLLELFPESTFVILQEIAAVKNRDPNNVVELARDSILTCGTEITTYCPTPSVISTAGCETAGDGALVDIPLVNEDNRDPSNFTSLDDFLDELGIREEVTEEAKARIATEVIELSTELKYQSVQASNAEKLFAEMKSVRQADNPEGRTDLYSWSKPEDTLYGKAATAIEFLLKRSDLKKPE